VVVLLVCTCSINQKLKDRLWYQTDQMDTNSKIYHMKAKALQRFSYEIVSSAKWEIQTQKELSPKATKMPIANWQLAWRGKRQTVTKRKKIEDDKVKSKAISSKLSSILN